MLTSSWNTRLSQTSGPAVVIVPSGELFSVSELNSFLVILLCSTLLWVVSARFKESEFGLDDF